MAPPNVDISQVAKQLRQVVSALHDVEESIIQDASKATFALSGFNKYAQEISQLQQEMDKYARDLIQVRNDMQTATGPALAAKQAELDQINREILERKRHMNDVKDNLQDFANEQKEIVNKLKDFKKNWTTIVPEQILEGLKDAWGLKGGDVQGFGGKLAGASTVAGAAASAAGMDTLGKVLIGFGKILPIIASFAQYALDAQDALIQFNKSVIRAGLSLQSIGAEAERAGGTPAEVLDDIAKSFRGMGAKKMFSLTGLSAEELEPILGAFEKGGTVLTEIQDLYKGSTSGLTAFQEAAKQASDVSRLLGIEVSDAAEQIGQAMEDFNQGPQTAYENFLKVGKASREAGFGTARFTALVSQSTSGMAMFNVHMDESARILKDISKSLGPKAAGEFLSQLSKGFTEEGLPERIRRVALTGKEFTQSVLDRNMKNMVERFKTEFAGQREAGDVITAFRNAGIDISGTTDDVVAALKKLGDGAKRTLMEGLVPNSNAFREAMKMLGAAGGDIAEQAESLSKLGMASKMAMILEQGTQIFQGRRLHELSPYEKIAFEKIFNISGEQRETLNMLSASTQAMSDALSKEQERIRKGGDFNEEAARKMAEKFGFFVDEQGRRRAMGEKDWARRNLAKEIGNSFQDLVMSRGDLDKDFELSKEARLVRDGVNATQSVKDVLMNTVASILQEISDMVGRIVTWLFSDKDAQTREQRLAADKILATQQKDLMTQMKETERDTTLTEPQKAKKIEELSRKREEIGTARAALQTGETVGGKRLTKAEDIAAFAKAISSSSNSSILIAKQIESLDSEISDLKERTEYFTGGGGFFQGLRNVFYDVATLGLDYEDESEISLKYGERAKLLQELRRSPGEKPSYTPDTFGEMVGKLAEEIEKLTRKNTVPIVGPPGAPVPLPTPPGPKANDLLVQFGAHGAKWSQRVDNQDVATVTKPGGALSKIGGRSITNTVVHNHFYNEGKGIFNSMVKWDRAMGRR